jgi:integrase
MPRSRRGNGSVFFDKSKQKWIGETRQTINGKRKARKCEAETKSTASMRLRQLQIEIAENRTSYDVSTETVGEYLRSWLESITSGPSTKLRHSSLLKNHVLPHDFAKRLRVQITARDVQQFYASLRLTVSASTARKVHALLHAAFEAALHSRPGVNRNPCSLPKNQIPKYTPSEANPFSTEKESAFLRALDGHPDEALYILALDSGMRQAELFALEWRFLNWNTNTVKVALTLKDTEDGLIVGEPKTKHVHLVVLSEATMGALASHQKRQVRLSGIQRLVFPDRVSGYMRRQNFNRRSFAPLLARAARESGLSFERHTFHDLRHTMATLLLRAGASPIDVAQRLGHANANTTLKTYAHCLPQDANRLAMRFDERFHGRTRSS